MSTNKIRSGYSVPRDGKAYRLPSGTVYAWVGPAIRRLSFKSHKRTTVRGAARDRLRSYVNSVLSQKLKNTQPNG